MSDAAPVDGATGAAAPPAPALWRLVLPNLSPIVTFNASGDGPPFYCVHSVTGDVTGFVALARQLGPNQPFHGLQVPRERQNPAAATSIEAMASYYAEKIVAFQPEGALVLGGWSVGAIIALEIARQLRAAGRDVPLLVAIDGAPCNTGAGISHWNPRYAWALVINVPRWVRDKGSVGRTWSWRALVRRFCESFVFRVRMAVPRIRNEQTLDGDTVQAILDADGRSSRHKSFIRALYDAARAYVPERYDGRVVVLEAKTGPLGVLRQISAAWAKIAAAVEIVTLKGNHVGILEEPGVDLLARRLRERLGDVRQPAAGAPLPGRTTPGAAPRPAPVAGR